MITADDRLGRIEDKQTTNIERAARMEERQIALVERVGKVEVILEEVAKQTQLNVISVTKLIALNEQTHNGKTKIIQLAVPAGTFAAIVAIVQIVVAWVAK